VFLIFSLLCAQVLKFVRFTLFTVMSFVHKDLAGWRRWGGNEMSHLKRGHINQPELIFEAYIEI